MSVAVSSAYRHPQAKPGMPEKTHLVQIDPTSQSPTAANPVAAGSVIEFLNMPTGSAAPGSYVDVSQSYMMVTVRILTAAAAQAGALTKVGVRGLFDRIQVNSSGYPVEDTQHHPQLLALLEDVRDKPEDRQGYRSMTLGLDPANRYKGGTFAARVGQQHTGSATFCIPLLGHFWNSTSRVPIHAITDLAYRLTLAAGPDGVVTPQGQVQV